MKNQIKNLLPNWSINILKKMFLLRERILFPITTQNRFFASIYYTLFSLKFARENRAVLSGKSEYMRKLKDPGSTSALLRRNIHRLEKGLIMEPRRETFAEGYISETVQAYLLVLKSKKYNKNELAWFTDVLTEYFNTVKTTDKIRADKLIFECTAPQKESIEKCIPYQYQTIEKSRISFEELHKLYRQRRSVRWFQEKSVSSDLIEKAISLASLAPSACNRQPYRFVVSQNPQNACKLASCAGGTGGWDHNIPCTIVIIGDLSAYPNERDRHLIYIDGSLAAMQLMLAFETLNLSTCPINWPDVEGAEQKLSKLLELRTFERPIMLMAVGYAKAKGGIAYSQKKDAKTLISYH